MENELFQKHILARVRKLESKAFDGTFEENYSKLPARKQAENISDGAKEHHVGNKSKEVLQQELNSHLQNHRENFSNDENRNWIEKKDSLIEQLKQVTNH